MYVKVFLLSVLVVVVGCVVVLVVSTGPGGRDRFEYKECGSGSDLAMCNAAFAAYGDCRAGRYAEYGRISCGDALTLADVCREKYQLVDKTTCIVAAFDLLECQSLYAGDSCNDLEISYLECLDGKGGDANACKRRRAASIECLSAKRCTGVSNVASYVHGRSPASSIL